MVNVVAALIWQNERFLACQRPAHKKRGLLWEFVGGKVEAGESLAQALVRECREELGVTVSPESVFMEVTHSYPDMAVRLTLFNAVIAEGIPQLLEHNDIRWITTGQIDEYDFCPADKDILLPLKKINNHIQALLFSCTDPSYKRFQLSLIPGMPEDRMMGVRMPEIRKIAKGISDISLLGPLPHAYHEEDCIHAILINAISDYDQTIRSLNDFLPYVNNWAVCDLLSPKSFRSLPERLIEQVRVWLSSSHPYTVRFAIGVLMKYYLDDFFSSDHLAMVCNLETENYYVKMGCAWYFATALAKQYSHTVKCFVSPKMDPWVHNKAIQKATESYRISKETKDYLRTLKIRGQGNDLPRL